MNGLVSLETYDYLITCAFADQKCRSFVLSALSLAGRPCRHGSSLSSAQTILVWFTKYPTSTLAKRPSPCALRTWHGASFCRCKRLYDTPLEALRARPSSTRRPRLLQCAADGRKSRTASKRSPWTDSVRTPPRAARASSAFSPFPEKLSRSRGGSKRSWCKRISKLRQHFRHIPIQVCVLSETSIRRRRFSGFLPGLFFQHWEQQEPQKVNLLLRFRGASMHRQRSGLAGRFACKIPYRIHHSTPFR